MPKSTSKYVSYILRFAVAGLVLYLIFRKDYGESFEGVKNALENNPWTAAASLGLFILSTLIFVARWYMLLRVQGIRIGYWPAVRLHFLGLFYSNCMPSSVGGDFLRAWYVTKHTDKKLEAALSVFVDRAVGLSGIFIMAFFAYWFIPSGQRGGDMSNIAFGSSFSEAAQYWWLLLAIAATAAVIMTAFILTRRGRKLFGLTWHFVRARGLKLIEESRVAIKIYYNKKLALVVALLLTFACQAVAIAAVWIIGVKIGITAGIRYYFIFFPISWILGLVPISVGGAGITEWFIKEMFGRVCVLENLGALAIYNRILIIIGSLPGAAIHLMGAHLPKEFFIDSNKPIN